MQNANFKTLPLSINRLTIALFYYYLIFTNYIPKFVYNLQIKMGYEANGLIRIEFQVLAYLIGIIPVLILLYPLLKSESKLDLKKITITILFVISLALRMNIVFSVFITFVNGGEYLSSANQDGLNILMEQNIFLHHFMVIFLAPLLEEMIFRGVIFRGIRLKQNFIIAALISSFFFGFGHVSVSLVNGDWMNFLYLFLYAGLGFLFCGTYEYNKSIWACILLHALYNAYTVLI